MHHNLRSGTSTARALFSGEPSTTTLASPVSYAGSHHAPSPTFAPSALATSAPNMTLFNLAFVPYAARNDSLATTLQINGPRRRGVSTAAWNKALYGPRGPLRAPYWSTGLLRAPYWSTG